MPYFVMTLDGIKLETSIAPDDEHTRIDSRVTEKLFGFDENSSGMEKSEDPAGQVHSAYRSMRIEGDGFSLDNFKVMVARRETGSCGIHTNRNTGAVGYSSCFGMPPLVLGLDVLRKLRVFVEPHTGYVFVSTADASRP